MVGQLDQASMREFFFCVFLLLANFLSKGLPQHHHCTSTPQSFVECTTACIILFGRVWLNKSWGSFLQSLPWGKTKHVRCSSFISAKKNCLISSSVWKQNNFFNCYQPYFLVMDDPEPSLSTNKQETIESLFFLNFLMVAKHAKTRLLKINGSIYLKVLIVLIDKIGPPHIGPLLKNK